MRDLLWSSSFLILAVCLMRRIFAGRMSMKHIYSLWLIVAIGLWVIPFSSRMPSSVFSILNLKDAVEEWVLDGAAGNQTADETIGDQAAANHQNGQLQGQGEGKAETTEIVENGQKGPENAANIAAFLKKNSFGRLFFQNQQLIFSLIWAAGALFMGSWMFWVNTKLKKEMLQKRVPLGKKSSIRFSEEWMKLPVYLVKDMESPCLLSIKGETGIYIPDHLLMEPESLRHAAAHEICHWRQKDLYWNQLRCILLAIYWFHPLVWAAAWLSRQDCELSCDESAVRLLGVEERFAYGRTLLSLVEGAKGRSRMLCGGTWMTAGGRQMKGRISWIAKGTKMTAVSAIAFYMLLCLTVSASFCQSEKEANTLEPAPFETLDDTKITAWDIRPLHSGADSLENAQIEAQLARFLTENHLSYVGDAVGSGRIVGACIRAIGLTSFGSTELQTSQEPYAYRLIFQEEEKENLDAEKIKAVSILAFASIDNLGVLEVYTGPDGIQKGEQFLQISRQEAMEMYGLTDLAGYGQSEEEMQKLVQLVTEKIS